MASNLSSRVFYLGYPLHDYIILEI
jgi:hypothetical protein